MSNISKAEYEKVLLKYRRPILLAYSDKNGFAADFYSRSITNKDWILYESSFISSTTNQIESKSLCSKYSYSRISELIATNFIFTDIRVIYKTYKKRKSLMKIDKKYAIEKTKEYFLDVIRGIESKKEIYLFLLATCQVLQKKHPLPNTEDIDKGIEKMFDVIEDWFKDRS